MAGEEGFEPSSTSVLETGVLPLNYSPILAANAGLEPAVQESKSCALPTWLIGNI